MTKGPGQSLQFSFGDAITRLRTSHPELSGIMEVMFGRFLSRQDESTIAVDSVHGPKSGFKWQAELDGCVYADSSFVDLVIQLENLIEGELLRGFANGILLHGAAVAKDGCVFLVLGPGYSGKTSIVLELVCRGYEFISDDYVLFDSGANHLLPFPKCAVLRKIVGELPPGIHRELPGHPKGWSYFSPDHCSGLEPEILQEVTILFLKHRPDSPVAIRRCQSAEALPQLLQRVYDLAGRERICFESLGSLAFKADAYQFDYQCVADLDVALQYINGD